MEVTIRKPVVAGAFYPEKKDELKKLINQLLYSSSERSESRSFIDRSSRLRSNKTPSYLSSLRSNNKRLKALIVPHAGYIYSGIVAATGFNLIKKQSFDNPKILLLGPSHYMYFDGFATVSHNFWETPLGNVSVNTLSHEISHKYPKTVSIIDEAFNEEHCLEVELPFLQTVLSSFSIAPFITCNGNPEVFANILNHFMPEFDLFIVSSDLSHYHFYEEANIIDAIANKSIPLLDVNNVTGHVEACGKIGILTLIYLAKKNNWNCVFIDYKNSGDTQGSKDAVVGYGCYAFYESPIRHSE